MPQFDHRPYGDIEVSAGQEAMETAETDQIIQLGRIDRDRMLACRPIDLHEAGGIIISAENPLIRAQKIFGPIQKILGG